LIVFHFAALGLTYATNTSSRRSSLQDRLHEFLQPYLIGLNWYQEMLPIEWPDTLVDSAETRIAIQSSTSDDWTTIISNRSTHLKSLSFYQQKSDRLIQLAKELIANENEDGLLRLLRSVVTHLDRAQDQTVSVRKIRVEQTGSENPLLEASVARFDDGEIGLIPRIDEHRQVRAKRSDRGNP
jgi:hypothetical protein